MQKSNKILDFEYDVAISYANEDREVAEQIAIKSQKKGISVFFDKFYKSDLWGKSLSKWFKKTYAKSSRFVLVLVSQYYPVKDWANFEFDIAREEEKKRKEEFILPVRLDNTIILGLPRDKAYLDFNKEGLNGIVNYLFQKVMSLSEKNPEQMFRKSYEEWKKEGFLPGQDKTNFFVENISKIKLDIDTCEFLLRSGPTWYYQETKEKMKMINKDILFNAALRLFQKENDVYDRGRAIGYLLFANPAKAEHLLWNLYTAENEDLKLRAAALGNFWICKSQKGMDESYFAALNNKKWELRKAAIKNIGHGKINKKTSTVLAKALLDGRWRVRAEAAEAIVLLKQHELIPNLIKAIKNEKSTKAKYQLIYWLRYFNSYKNVKKFGRMYNLSKSFYKKPEDLVIEDPFEDML